MQSGKRRYGKLRLSLMIALLLLVPAVLYAQAEGEGAAEAQGRPKIVFESLSHDFGTVQDSTSLKHSFVFKNEGSALLVIDKVKAG